MGTHDRWAEAFTLLHDLGLTAPIFGDDAPPPVRDTPAARLPAGAAYPTRLWLWQPARPVASFARAAHLTNREAALMTELRVLLPSGRAWFDLPDAARKRLTHAEHFDQVRHAWRATLAADTNAAIDADLDRLTHDGVGLAPPPWVTGGDLIAAGHPPGPDFRPRLDAAYDAQLEGRVTNKDQALAAALTAVPAGPPGG